MPVALPSLTGGIIKQLRFYGVLRGGPVAHAFFFILMTCGSQQVFGLDGLKGATFLYFREVLLYDLWLGGSVCPAGQAIAAFYYSSLIPGAGIQYQIASAVGGFLLFASYG